MTSFAFRALDRHGVTQSGVREAASQDEVVSWLSAAGLIPVEVRAGGARMPQWLASPLRARRAIASDELVRMTLQLATLLHAGLNLDRALSIVRRLADRPAMRALLDRLLERLRAGSSFADALQQERDLPPHYVSMTRAGEASGALADALTRLGQFLSRSQEIRARIRSALVYPVILSLTVVATLIVVVTVVLPRFESLFEASEAPIPLATRIVLALGSVVADYGWFAALLAVAAGAFAWSRVRAGPGRVKLDGLLLRSRWTFGLPAMLETARYLRTASTLCTGGLPLPGALRIAQEGIANSAFRAAATPVLVGIKEGEALSPLLDRAAVYPKLAVQLARVGEETGRLPEMLMQAAEMLDAEAHGTIERLLALLVPVVTLALGGLVALLIGSVLVGILSVNDLAF